MSKIPLTVVHYARFDPLRRPGGVSAFARNLRLIFEEVVFMHRKTLDAAYVEKNRLPVICDFHTVQDWPERIPLIAFLHGLASVKWQVTHSLTDFRLARAQSRAVRRNDVVWAACAKWISRQAKTLYGLDVRHVIYHPVDMDQFDGRLTGENPRLILHDARTNHKGRRLVKHLASNFSDWTFEPLRCRPEHVPERLASARAFIHLSRYEGNSLVANEAMAMNLPCLFTDVGLFRDEDGPTEVYRVETEKVFRDRTVLEREFAAFAASLDVRIYNPRIWMLRQATPEKSREGWRKVMAEFQRLSGWEGRPG